MPRPLAWSLAALSVVGCGCTRGGSVAGPDPAARLQVELPELVWNPAGPFPQVAGNLVLRHEGEVPAIAIGPLDRSAPLSFPEALVPPGGHIALPVVIRAPLAEGLSLFAEYDAGASVHGCGVVHLEAVNACADAQPWIGELRALVADAVLPSGFYDGYREGRRGVPVRHAAPVLGARIPSMPFTEIEACGGFAAPIAAGAFCDGVAAGGAPDGEDSRVLLWMRLAGAPSPDAIADLHLQYAFALEIGGDRTDDYRPAADFAADAFAGTDRWYELLGQPARGWRLRVTDARDRRYRRAPSAAVAVVRGNLVVLAVPAGELAGATGYRASAFSHAGDFGLLEPHRWSGDREPPVASGLHPPTW